ncbi:MAG: alpha/beta fold hydrolase [Planctomycetia bacterium]
MPGPAGAGERGLGRGGPVRLLWAADGRGLAALVKGERVWVDLATGAARRLTEGGSAHLSFEADNHLWVVPTAGGPAWRVLVGSDPQVLTGTLDWLCPEELGIEHAAWGSPDGQRLAVLTLDQRGVPTYAVPDALDARGASEPMHYPRAGERNPVARLWVVPVGTAQGARPAPVELPLQDEYLARVAWLPDGSRVLAVTLDRAQRRVRLQSFPAQGGPGAVLLEDSDPAWHEPPPAPRFVDGTRLLWRSLQAGEERWQLLTLEATGTRLLERRSLATGEVELGALLHVDAAGQRALASGHVRGARQRALWRVGLEPGAELEALVPAQDLDVAGEVDASGRWLLQRSSRFLEPPRLHLVDLAGGAARLLGDARTPAWDALVQPVVEQGESVLGDGVRVPWRLLAPRKRGARLPLVLLVYGGPGSRTVEERFGGLWPLLLVHEGFAVLHVDGRGTGGQGAAHERLLRGRLGDVDHAGLPEVLAGLCARHPWIDATRVGIWGWSYGGTLACDALLRRPDVFRCAVGIAPVTDWRLYDTIYTERYMGLPAAEAAAYDATSQLLLARAPAQAGTPCRLLLLHGLSDDNVHPLNTLRLVEALLAARRTGFAWQLYANRGHGLGDAQRDVHRRSLEWLRQHLQAEGR